MDTKVNYATIGLFVIVLTLALVAGVLWLSAQKGSKNYVTYVALFHEQVTGLSEQSPVRFNGVRVGFVKSIKLDTKDPQLVRLELKVEQGTPITTSTVGMLSSMGITGVLYVSLKALSTKGDVLKKLPGQLYPMIPTQPSLLTKLSKVLPQVTKSAQQVSKTLQSVFSKKNMVEINETLNNINDLTKNLAQNSDNLHVSMDALRKTLQNTAAASAELPAVLDQLKASLKEITAVSVAFKKSAGHVNAATDSIAKTMTSSRVALNNISRQVVPTAQQMLSRLNNVAANLQQLTAMLNHNPSVLVRGKSPMQPGPGEGRQR